MSPALIGIILVVVLVVWIVAIYNTLVRLKNNRENAFADIDVQLKQRHDLVPQLVGAVKGYMEHERETLDSVTRARQRAISATSINDKIVAEKELAGALSGLNIQLEAYPDLKANQNFLSLQEELASTENKVAYSRQLYNKTVADYNIKRESFPTNFIAGMFGFKHEEQLTIPEVEREVPKISF